MEINSIVVRKNPALLVYKMLNATIVIYILFVIYSLLVGSEASFFANVLVNQFLFLLVSISIEIIVLVYLLLQWSMNQYEITDTEIIRRKGIIWRHSGAHSLKDAQSVYVKKGLFGSLFNYGTLVVHNPFSKEELRIRGVADVNKYAEIIRSLLQQDSNTKRVIIN